MATGPEHYADAEQLLAQADEWLDGEDAPDSFELVHARRAEDLTAAQVHATLALAAVTALSEGGMMPGGEFDAWAAVCASQPIPAAGPAPVWWHDDGGESPEPDLFVTYEAACAAAVAQFKDDNPHYADADPAVFIWRPEPGEGAEGKELSVNGHLTGIIVRPIRPKDGA